MPFMILCKLSNKMDELIYCYNIIPVAFALLYLGFFIITAVSYIYFIAAVLSLSILNFVPSIYSKKKRERSCIEI
jgi:hypothetical protein